MRLSVISTGCCGESIEESVREPSASEYTKILEFMYSNNISFDLDVVYVFEGTGDIVIFSKGGEYFTIYASDSMISESAIRQYKRVGNEIKRRFRCSDGPKRGKLVINASDCLKRKKPIRVRIGRKVMREKKKIIQHKGQATKKRAVSKLVKDLNKKLEAK